MPPKHKKVGRPLGSKNKKSLKVPAVLREIKSEANFIKAENVPITNSGCSDSFAEDDHKLSVQNIATKKIMYNCKKCSNKNFKFENNYKEHLLLEHSTIPGSVGCLQCHVVCPDNETLKVHVSKVHERNIFVCRYCSKEFVRQAHVLRHMAQKGCDGSTVTSYPCEICNAKFTRKDNLIVHLRQMHIRRQLYECKQPNCNFASKNLTKLIRHWHAYHAEIPHQFECDLCGKSTMSRAAMAKHLEIHGEKKYACDVCGYSTYTIEVMRRHILTHVDEKPYKCEICGNSYIQRAQLERHLEKHTRTDCEVCGAQFSCKARLLIHQAQHRGLDKLQCPFGGCTKLLVDEESLFLHVNLHLQQKVKSWSCDVCFKLFSSEMNMRRHLSTHTLDRPRRCMYCVSARAYVRGQQLVRHVRKYHRDVFATHLAHVRNVLVSNQNSERVSKSELESILTLLDAESERILEGYSGAGVLYGGMQPLLTERDAQPEFQEEDSPLMSEEVLAENLSKLLVQLIDEETLQCLGWPEESVDNLLEKVIEQCGAKAADREKWSRVQRLRENAKHLFLHVVDDKNVSMMLGTHTIDQIVRHILAQAGDSDADIYTSRNPAGQVEIEIEVS